MPAQSNAPVDLGLASLTGTTLSDGKKSNTANSGSPGSIKPLQQFTASACLPSRRSVRGSISVPMKVPRQNAMVPTCSGCLKRVKSQSVAVVATCCATSTIRMRGNAEFDGFDLYAPARHPSRTKRLPLTMGVGRRSDLPQGLSGQPALLPASAQRPSGCGVSTAVQGHNPSTHHPPVERKKVRSRALIAADTAGLAALAESVEIAGGLLRPLRLTPPQPVDPRRLPVTLPVGIQELL